MQNKNRKPNRLKNFDYSQNGMYFVTICTKNREHYFGKIENGKRVLNELGKIIFKNLKNIPKDFNDIFLDRYVVMPNHIHLIIEINKSIVGADLVSAQKQTIKYSGQTQGLSLHNIQNIGLLSKIIQSFKSKSSVEYIKLMDSRNKTCITNIWQRSFHDRIIRNEIELNKIREYILTNPKNWERDRNNTENILM